MQNGTVLNTLMFLHIFILYNDFWSFHKGGFQSYKIPLNPTLLSTSSAAVNNVNSNSFPSGAADANNGYMSDVSGSRK